MKTKLDKSVSRKLSDVEVQKENLKISKQD
jgi:hypothetical protein